MVAIPYFSTETFYRSVTGTPLDSSVGWGQKNIAIPSDGVHFVPPVLEGVSTAELLRTLERAQCNRESFTATIARGEIPPIIAPSTAPSTSLSIVYLPLRDLHAEDMTVAELLGAIPRLTKIASQANSTACPVCASVSPILRSAGELAAIINAKYEGHEISLTARGPSDALLAWATRSGFSLHEDDAGEPICVLDSFRCSMERIRTLTPLMRSALHCPDLHLEVRHGKGADNFALSGFCPSCKIVGSPLREALLARELSKAVPAPECGALFREAHGVPLHTAAKLSLDDLRQLPDYQPSLTPDQWDAIERLSVLEVSLAATLSELSPHTLATLALIATLTIHPEGKTLRVFDGELSLLSETTRDKATSLAREWTRTAPLLWISMDPVTVERPLAPLNQETYRGAPLGTLLVKHSSEHTERVELRAGSIIEVPCLERSPATRLGREIARALDTQSSSVCSFNNGEAIDSHFIPFYPPRDRGTLSVAHALDLFEPLATLFAASHKARMLGISPRSLSMSPTKRSPALCSECWGLGVTMHEDRVHPCHGCWGTRYRSPFRSITFRGKTLWEYLNTPIAVNEPTLRALPKRAATLDLVTHLTIAHLPLGMPLRALSGKERRLFSIAKEVITATTKRPKVLVLEDPFVDLSQDETRGLHTVMRDPTWRERVCWVLVR